MKKGNGYALIILGIITPFICSMAIDCPMSISLPFGVVMIICGILCISIDNKRTQQKNAIGSAVNTAERSSYSSTDDTYIGRRAMSFENHTLPSPCWLSAGFVAAAVVFLFMAVFVTIAAVSLNSKSDNTVICIIVWIVALIVVAFDLYAYFSNKSETIDKLRGSEYAVKRKAKMLGAKRDRQNNLDKAERLTKQAQVVLEQGYQKYHNAANQKEGDWAVVGGIAQGIGGLGAGLFAAASTISNNAKIRQDNEIRTAYRAMVMEQTVSKRIALLDEADNLKRRVVNEYPIHEDTPAFFANLSINRAYYRSSWGPTVIQLRIHNGNAETIFGSLGIILKYRGKEVANTFILLPDEGIEPNKEGLCYTLCTPRKLDPFACLNTDGIKDPWHDAMEIRGEHLWIKA